MQEDLYPHVDKYHHFHQNSAACGDKSFDHEWSFHLWDEYHCPKDVGEDNHSHAPTRCHLQ